MTDTTGSAGEQLSALRRLVAGSLLPTHRDRTALVLALIADAAEALAPCVTVGIMLGGEWQDVGRRGRGADRGDVESALGSVARDWLGTLLDYDTVHGAQLVTTLSEYLDSGGSYDTSATALSVYRSTLKYRLRRIREVSGYDLSVPDAQFNLQLVTRAWRTLQALRQA